MSRRGTRTSSARRLLAASVPYVTVKISDATIAASIRKVVRSAYSGRFAGSSETTGSFSAESGARVSWAPLAASSRSPKTNGKAMMSQQFGTRPRAVRLA
jgi:hypothetical protein